MREQPSKGDLPRRSALAFSNLFQEWHQSQIMLEGISAKPWNSIAYIALTILGVGINRPGEKALAQRRKGHKANTQFFQRRNDLRLWIAEPE